MRVPTGGSIGFEKITRSRRRSRRHAQSAREYASNQRGAAPSCSSPPRKPSCIFIRALSENRCARRTAFRQSIRSRCGPADSRTSGRRVRARPGVAAGQEGPGSQQTSGERIREASAASSAAQARGPRSAPPSAARAAKSSCVTRASGSAETSRESKGIFRLWRHQNARSSRPRKFASRAGSAVVLRSWN